MSRPFLSDLSDRLERNQACYLSLQTLFAEFHEACAAQDWTRAEKIRTILIETVEVSLDTTVAIFKNLDTRNGKAA